MTAEQKVKVKYPDAVVYGGRHGKVWIGGPLSGQLSDVMAVGTREQRRARAWRNAAARIAPEAGNDQEVPPQPKCKNCGKFKAMHQGWRWCDIPAKPNSFFQPDDEPEPHPVSAEPEKRPEVPRGNCAAALANAAKPEVR